MQGFLIIGLLKPTCDKRRSRTSARSEQYPGVNNIPKGLTCIHPEVNCARSLFKVCGRGEHFLSKFDGIIETPGHWAAALSSFMQGLLIIGLLKPTCDKRRSRTSARSEQYPGVNNIPKGLTCIHPEVNCA